MLGELATDAAAERTDFLVAGDRAASKFLDAQPATVADARRPDADRRRPGLPRPSRPTGRSASGAGTRTRRRASGSPRPRSSRTPPSWSSSTTRPRSRLVRRGGPRGGRHGRPADRRRRPARHRRHRRPRRRSSWATTTAYARRRRRLGRRRRRGRRDADDEEAAAALLYDLALDFQERSQRCEARLIEQFEDAVSRPRRPARRPDHPRRRGRAAVSSADGAFEAEVLPEDGDGQWRDARPTPEEHRRVLRPDRRVRRPRRGARRGVPGRGAAEGEEGEDGGGRRGRRGDGSRRRGRGRRPARRLGERTAALVADRRAPGARGCASPGRSSSSAGSSCPAPGSRRGTRPRRPARGPASTSTSARPRRAASPLRVPYPIATADAATGNMTILAGVGVLGGRGPAGRPRGHAGPLGRPFEVDPRSRHLLLIAEGPAIAGLRFLVDEAVRDGRSVVLLYGAPRRAWSTRRASCPTRWSTWSRPPTGRWVTRARWGDLVPSYEAWADQAFAAGRRRCSGALLDAGGGAAGTPRRRDAGPEARGRAAAGVGIDRVPAEGLPPGGRGPGRGLRRGDLPRLRGRGHGSGRRSGRAARARCSPPASSPGARREAQAQGRPGDAHPARTPTVRRIRPAITPAPRFAPGPPGRGAAPGATTGAPAGASDRRPRSTSWAAGPCGSRWTSAAAWCCRTRCSPRRGRSGSAWRWRTSSTCRGSGARDPRRVAQAARRAAGAADGTIPAGLLVGVGLQHPGLAQVLERYAATWARWSVPVIVNLGGDSAGSSARRAGSWTGCRASPGSSSTCRPAAGHGCSAGRAVGVERGRGRRRATDCR